MASRRSASRTSCGGRGRPVASSSSTQTTISPALDLLCPAKHRAHSPRETMPTAAPTNTDGSASRSAYRHLAEREGVVGASRGREYSDQNLRTINPKNMYLPLCLHIIFGPDFCCIYMVPCHHEAAGVLRREWAS